jgi:tRNA(fMet)-specific endonuclease VapC
MLRWMLDTDVCIRVLRDRPPGLRDRFNAEAGALCISAVTLGELMHGAHRSADPERARAAVGAFAGRLRVLPYDEAAAGRFGALRADLQRRGAEIGPYDLMIAAHALSLGLAVATGNLREFTRVEGLHVEDWLATSS